LSSFYSSGISENDIGKDTATQIDKTQEEPRLRLVAENKQKQTLLERRQEQPPLIDDTDDWWKSVGVAQAWEQAEVFQKKLAAGIESYPKFKKQRIKEVIERQMQALKDLPFRIDSVISSIDFAKKLLPSFDVPKLKQELLDYKNKIKQQTNTRNFDPELFFPSFVVHTLAQRAQELFQQESLRYFAPLIERARGDIRMFLIEYARKRGLRPEQTSLETEQMKHLLAFIDGRSAVALPIEFYYTFLQASHLFKDQETAHTDARTVIRVNMDTVCRDLFKDGVLDEKKILETIFHEMVHAISDWKSEDILGVSDPALLPDRVFDEKFNPIEGEKIPAIYLNEIRTELLSLAQMKKYYQREIPGTIHLQGKDEQTYYGYSDLIERYARLEESYPVEMQELGDLLLDSMLMRDLSKVHDFFNTHPKIYAEVHYICTLAFVREKEDPTCFELRKSS